MRILSIGTVNDVKNFSQLVDIAVLLRKRKLNFRLEIIGDGPLLEELTATVRKFMIEDIVILSGWKSHEEVMYSLLRSDIYVQTSKSESFCYTITEAMAVGLPVVAYRVGGIPEVVTDEQSGYLIDFGDTESFANAVTMLAKNVEIREKFGAFGRASLSRFR
jgi:glycosyltransferase involved in cell wall biosynthesis